MWISLSFVLPGCQATFTEETVAGTRHLSAQVTSGVNGAAVVDVPVEEGETALLATAQVASPRQVHFRSLEDPDRRQVFDAFAWNDSPYSKTNAGFIAGTSTLNWPVQLGDPALIAGRWALTLGVVDEGAQYVSAPVAIDIYLKADPDFGTGALAVSIVYAGAVGEDDAVRAAVDAARSQWVDLYAQMGIDVTFTNYLYTDGTLAAPAFGEEPAYTDIASQTEPRSVNLVLTDVIDEIDGIFGIAGDIPGPLVPSPRSAVLISTDLASGTDGEFSAEDVRLLAETMAHEVGHYLGLYHPVESDFDAWDLLDDTAECVTEGGCIDALGDNLMFPYPVCGAVSCTPQDKLTVEQTEVANRYVGVK